MKLKSDYDIKNRIWQINHNKNKFILIFLIIKSNLKDYILTKHFCNSRYLLVDVYHFNKWVEATVLAKKLNLLDKQQRVDLFNYVKFGEL